MTILQLEPFDITTSPPVQLLATAGFWSNLPRLAGNGLPLARLLMVTDTLKASAVESGFKRAAVPENENPPGVRAYRLQYEEFLRQVVRDVRYMRLYLVFHAGLSDADAVRLSSVYGMRARPLRDAVPRPFTRGVERWNHVEDENGGRWALLRSTSTQYGSVFARSLHRLVGLEFPVWAALNVYTFPQSEAIRKLRLQAVSVRYAPNRSPEEQQETSDVANGVMRLRAEMNRAGSSLHTVRLYVLVGGEDSAELQQRLEIVRGSLPFEMELVCPPGEVIRQVFSAESFVETDGAPMTTPGVALLAGSALSYRRRTETRGVLLGIDRNQSPVVLNLFDDRNPSYNSVILGETGSGKTFAAQLLMLRHLLMGTRLVIVDPQGNIDLSFFGPGVYHKAVLGTEQAAINILDVTQDELSNQVEGVRSMLGMLGVLPPLDTSAPALMDEALMRLYQPRWGQQVEMPTLQQLQRELETLEGQSQTAGLRELARTLAYNLGQYTQGSRAALFGRPTTVDFSLNAAVTVYDISRLPQQEQGGSLRSALLSILVGDVNQAIRRRRRAGDRAPILFFVDEMGVLMRDRVIASHVSYEYKTARARLVGMMVADQDLHSLLGPQDEQGLHHGAPMLANAANTFIFMQKDSELARVREHFPGLPDSLVNILPVMARGTCIARLNDDLLLVNVLASAFDQVVLSSRLQDRAYARQVIRKMVQEIFQ